MPSYSGMDCTLGMFRPKKVCICRSVSRCEIEEAIRKGAHSLAAIQAVTRASTGCGTCLLDVVAIHEETLRAMGLNPAMQGELFSSRT